MEPASESPECQCSSSKLKGLKFLKNVSDLFLFVCVCLNECKPHMCLLTKAQRESRVSWSWRYRQLGTTQTGSSGRASATLQLLNRPSSSLAKLPRVVPHLLWGGSEEMEHELQQQPTSPQKGKDRVAPQLPRHRQQHWGSGLAASPRCLLYVRSLLLKPPESDTDFSSLLLCVLLFR